VIGSTAGARSIPRRALLDLLDPDGGNPWRARSAEEAGRVALPYRDLAEQSVLWDDQMRRLLRQEEDLAANCGCSVP